MYDWKNALSKQQARQNQQQQFKRSDPYKQWAFLILDKHVNYKTLPSMHRKCKWVENVCLVTT